MDREDSQLAEDAEDSGVDSQDGEETEANFEGDTLQSAQDKIVAELTRLKDSE